MIVGIPDETSKYVYEIDSKTNTVIQVFERNQPMARKFSEGVTRLVGIKKICYAWNMAKATVTEARNTTEMSRQLLDSGSIGKMVLLEGVTVADIDNPAEYAAAGGVMPQPVAMSF